MNNRVNRLVPMILLVAVLGLGVTACGGPSIEGKWEAVMNPGSSIEFFSDGRVELVSLDETLIGTYETEEGNRLTIIITGMFEGPEGEYGMMFANYEIDGDIMTLIQQGNTSTWVRAD